MQGRRRGWTGVDYLLAASVAQGDVHTERCLAAAMAAKMEVSVDISERGHFVHVDVSIPNRYWELCRGHRDCPRAGAGAAAALRPVPWPAKTPTSTPEADQAPSTPTRAGSLAPRRDIDRAGSYPGRAGGRRPLRRLHWGVFACRLLPVVRNFVAVPAGVAEVPLLRFVLLTAAGSFIWDSAMALIGYEVGRSWRSVMYGFNDAGYLLGALAAVAIAVFLVHRYRSYKSATAGRGHHSWPR